MGILNSFQSMENVFPKTITNEFIRNMPRRQLTPDEQKLPYAKYYTKDMAPIPEADLERVNRGPVDPALATPIEDCAKLLEEGDLPVETGYCVMPDGSGFAATKVIMPGVTTEMIDWWFNWHPLENLRYAIWCPVAHAGISAQTPNDHLDSSGVPLHIRNIGKVHYPIEGFDLKNAQKIEIAFRPPEVLGLTMEQIEASPVTTFEIATCTVRDFGIPINVFFHSVREIPGGIEYRSRYWLKHTIKNGKPHLSHSPIPGKELSGHMARCNCIHSLTEYNHLASILPSLYAEMGGRIE